MFSWVCSRCGHEVPPSKTECPFCFPAPVEGAPAQAAPPPQQYQPPPPQQPAPPQYPPPPQYGQPGPPQYWQPQPPPQYMPPPGPPQYWQPQGTQQYQMPPGQPLPPNPYPPAPQQQYAPPPPEPQYQPPQPQYQPPIIADVRKAEPTPWPTPEEREGKPMWLVATLTAAGVLAIFALAYFLMGSHGSSAAKDAAAKQATDNPLGKYIQVDGIRLVSGGRDVKFFVVNHGAADISELAVKVTLWASTQRSEEDSVGSFTFHLDTLASNDAKEMTASLKTDKQAYELPDDWRNLSADVQITSGQ